MDLIVILGQNFYNKYKKKYKIIKFKSDINNIKELENFINKKKDICFYSICWIIKIKL